MYQIGSELSVPKQIFKHKGVYAGNNLVFHNSPGQGEALTSMSEFAKGRPVTVEKEGVKDYQVFFTRLQKAIAAPKSYDVFQQNCEHSSSKVRTGKARSPQLIGWTALITVLFLYAATSRK